jgi:hypothetical protein
MEQHKYKWRGVDVGGLARTYLGPAAALVANSKGKGCQECLGALDAFPFQDMEKGHKDNIILMTPSMRCDTCNRIPFMYKFLRGVGFVLGLTCACLGLYEYIRGRICAPYLMMGVPWNCMFGYFYRRIWIMREDGKWITQNVHVAFVMKCQALAIRILASGSKSKTFWSEGIGTFGNTLSGIRANSEAAGSVACVNNVNAAVRMHVVGCWGALSPDLILGMDRKSGLSYNEQQEDEEFYAPCRTVRKFLTPKTQGTSVVEIAMDEYSPIFNINTTGHLVTGAPIDINTTCETGRGPSEGYYPEGMFIMGYVKADISNLAPAPHTKIQPLDPWRQDPDNWAVQDFIEYIDFMVTEYGFEEANRIMLQGTPIVGVDPYTGGNVEVDSRPITPQARVIGPLKEIPFIAGMHKNNELAAMCTRHYGEQAVAGMPDGTALCACAEITQVLIGFLQAQLKLATAVADYSNSEPTGMKSYSKQAMLAGQFDVESLISKAKSEKDRMAMVESAFYSGLMFGKPPDRKSKDFRKGHKPLNHSFFVKPDEALDKEKPRGIQWAKPIGTALHSYDKAVLDKVLFSISLFEGRSIKNAGPRGLRKRLGMMLDNYLYALSGDYGKFDASTTQIRKAIENAVIDALLADFCLECPAADQAMKDTFVHELRTRSANWKLHSLNPGRESGDRGTSVLNYLTNFVLFLYFGFRESMHRAQTTQADSEPDSSKWHKNADLYKIGMAWVRDWLYRRDFHDWEWFGEGDDNLHLWSVAFIDAAPGYTRKDKLKDFAHRLIKYAECAGFILEPQGVHGTASLEESITLVSERAEFVSKIIRTYPTSPVGKKGTKGYGMYTIFLPKLQKTLRGSTVTFCKAEGLSTADMGVTKMFGMMHNCVDVPILFHYAFCFYRYFTRQGGSLRWAALRNYDREALVDQYGPVEAGAVEKVLQSHDTLLLNTLHLQTVNSMLIGECAALGDSDNINSITDILRTADNEDWQDLCSLVDSVFLRLVF